MCPSKIHSLFAAGVVVGSLYIFVSFSLSLSNIYEYIMFAFFTLIVLYLSQPDYANVTLCVCVCVVLHTHTLCVCVYAQNWYVRLNKIHAQLIAILRLRPIKRKSDIAIALEK